ncbi:hypothetical protein GDO81_027213 [Engystomops pustulosus]|uniref:Uncharacterized protein n=1 Tax=Engystomops pustulosus TaxID=76066 RepID=A0AAV6ZKM3_ENGPU|nr:hypothetical protein GDO81_027213 [Engystomops pustulosus]
MWSVLTDEIHVIPSLPYSVIFLIFFLLFIFSFYYFCKSRMIYRFVRSDVPPIGSDPHTPGRHITKHRSQTILCLSFCCSSVQSKFSSSG